jgi:hypothetical protein
MRALCGGAHCGVFSGGLIMVHMKESAEGAFCLPHLHWACARYEPEAERTWYPEAQ